MPELAPTNRLVFLHGFTQTHHHWHQGASIIASRLGSSPSLAFVDLPGHGLSGADASDIVDAAASLPNLAGPGTWVGYSMGGRHALLAAAERAPQIERLVLIGATAGIDDADARAQRVDLDRNRADHVEAIGVEPFVDEWLNAPMFAGLPPDPSGVEHRRRNTATGLAHSLRTAGTGAQPSLWGRLASIEVPVLVLAGDRDTKFTEIGRAMVDELPNGTFERIADAGHAAHTEQPTEAARVIADWLV